MKKSKKKNKKQKKLLIAGMTLLGTANLAFLAFKIYAKPQENSSKSPSIAIAEPIVELEGSKLLAQSESVALESTLSFDIQRPALSSLIADSQSSTDSPSPLVKKYPRVDFRYFFDIGANYTKVNMKPQDGHSYNGTLGGAQGCFEYKPLQNFYEGLFVTWKQGHIEGHHSQRRSLLYIDVQERFGYTLGNVRSACTFYTGFGYRHYGQTLRAHSSNRLSLKYNELYVPVGLESEFACTSWFSIGINGNWMPQVYPSASLSTTQGLRWKLTSTLNNFSVQLPLNFAVAKSKKCRIILNPFYEKWHDGHSTVRNPIEGSSVLPGNAYSFWGGEFNFLYSF